MRKLLSSVAVSLCFSPFALAQQSPGGSSAPVAGAVTLGTSVEQQQLVAEGWRASKLLHSAVYNDQNQRIGKIDDLVIAPDGTVSVAVIDVGGFLGVGRHRVAVPVEQFSALSPRIVLPGASKQALKALPQFAYARQANERRR